MLALRCDQHIESKEESCLQVSKHALLLPPSLAGLLSQLPLRRNNNRKVMAPNSPPTYPSQARVAVSAVYE